MRVLSLKLIVLICAVPGFGQSYFALRNDGALPQGYFLDKIYDADKTILLNQPSNQVLSSQDQIPFDFYFYNTPVSYYKASDNGYITFNPNALNSLVPDTALPENSIVVFGKDFKLQKLPAPNEGVGTQVYSYTVGKAPKRSHIIQYYGASLANDPLNPPINNSSIFAFAIILHEGPEGRFDLVYSPYGNKFSKGSIGCASASNTTSTLFKDSLVYLPYQFSFNLDDFIVYQFHYGSQSAFDLAFKDLKVEKVYPFNSVVNFKGKMSNWGKNVVNSYTVNYSINAGDTISYLIDQLNLMPNGEGNMSFNHPISWLSGALGSLNDVNIWLSDPNNGIDGVADNSHFRKTVLRNNNTNLADRNILVEEGTGAWCGYCPGANLIINSAYKQYGRRVIPISYHFDDSMGTDDGNLFLSQYINSYPDAIIDRKILLGSNNTWLAEMTSRINIKAPVEVSIQNKVFNPQSRVISYRVRVKFVDYWYGVLRIGSAVTEDKVRGMANPFIWSQNNYYSKNNPSGPAGGISHPLYNESVVVDGYWHQHVQKANPSGVWGISNLIPQLVAPNSEYFADFSYTLPAASFVSYNSDYNSEFCSTIDAIGQNEGIHIPANINLIGFVEEYDENDVFNRPIINAASAPLWDLLSVRQENVMAETISLYPNPSNGICNIKLKLGSASPIKIEVYNVNGQLLQSSFHGCEIGINNIVLDTLNLNPGLYALKMVLNGKVLLRNIVIQ
jgi:hypothetical protein